MAKKSSSITHLFLDIGGVLLTNGWDHNARKRACAKFKLEHAEVENRHRLIADLFDLGQVSLDEYLSSVIFYKKRNFSLADIKRFMFAQSKPYPKMIGLMKKLKDMYELKVIAVSNESIELNAYRIKKFKLDTLFDAFISSCYVHVRKPDPQIFQLALDVSHADIKKVLYIENTAFFVEVAEMLGLQSLLHTDYTSTVPQLAAFNLKAK